MKMFSILVFLITLAIFSRAETHQDSHGAPHSHTENLPTTPFSVCEQKVLNTYSKYFGKSKIHKAFHVMLACAGLQGDPLNRKGWKNYLPICPAEPPDSKEWTEDWSNSIAKYHPCADSCFKHSSKRSWSQIMSEEKALLGTLTANVKSVYNWLRQLPEEDVSILNRHFPAQQCCYSRGKLITDGPGAGTPDTIFLSPRKTPKRLRPTGPLRAALFHERFDVSIIEDKFPNWPKGWEDYWILGWAPVPTRAPRYWGFDSHNRSCEHFKN